MGKDEHTGRKVALGAIIGGIAGFVTGILTASKSGKETREDIKDKAGEIKDSSVEQLQMAQAELANLLEETKTKSVALGSKAREEFNETVIKAKDAQNKATTIIKSIRAGQADDPALNKAIKQVQQAKKNLGKYLRG